MAFMKPRLLYVRLSPEALGELVQRAEAERRRPQDEAGLIIERALGLHPDREVREGRATGEDLKGKRRSSLNVASLERGGGEP